MVNISSVCHHAFYSYTFYKHGKPEEHRRVFFSFNCFLSFLFQQLEGDEVCHWYDSWLLIETPLKLMSDVSFNCRIIFGGKNVIGWWNKKLESNVFHITCEKYTWQVNQSDVSVLGSFNPCGHACSCHFDSLSFGISLSTFFADQIVLCWVQSIRKTLQTDFFIFNFVSFSGAPSNSERFARRDILASTLHKWLERGSELRKGLQKTIVRKRETGIPKMPLRTLGVQKWDISGRLYKRKVFLKYFFFRLSLSSTYEVFFRNDPLSFRYWFPDSMAKIKTLLRSSDLFAESVKSKSLIWNVVDRNGWNYYCSTMGHRVAIPGPEGSLNPLRSSRRLDLPTDWLPTTTISGIVRVCLCPMDPKIFLNSSHTSRSSFSSLSWGSFKWRFAVILYCH